MPVNRPSHQYPVCDQHSSQTILSHTSEKQPETAPTPGLVSVFVLFRAPVCACDSATLPFCDLLRTSRLPYFFYASGGNTHKANLFSALLFVSHLGTPNMSLSRSPSPSPDGGWSSPGLNINGSGRSSPAKAYGDSNGSASHHQRITGASKYPSFATQNQGFFTRHMRQLSSSLPRFNANAPNSRASSYSDKDKSKGRWEMGSSSLLGRVKLFFARMGRTTRIRLALVLAVLAAIYIFYHSRECSHERVLSLLHCVG